MKILVELIWNYPNTITFNEAFVFTLPGKCLDVSHVVNKKKFHSRGGREGCFNAMKKLEENKLGKLAVKYEKGSINVIVCHKYYT